MPKKLSKIIIFEKNMDILKSYLMKTAMGYKYLCLGKYRKSIQYFNNTGEPLNLSHFVLINTAIAYMHLVKYENAEKLFNFAFKKEPFRSYGLDYYRSVFTPIYL